MILPEAAREAGHGIVVWHGCLVLARQPATAQANRRCPRGDSHVTKTCFAGAWLRDVLDTLRGVCSARRRSTHAAPAKGSIWRAHPCHRWRCGRFTWMLTMMGEMTQMMQLQDFIAQLEQERE